MTKGKRQKAITTTKSQTKIIKYNKMTAKEFKAQIRELIGNDKTNEAISKP